MIVWGGALQALGFFGSEVAEPEERQPSAAQPRRRRLNWRRWDGPETRKEERPQIETGPNAIVLGALRETSRALAERRAELFAEQERARASEERRARIAAKVAQMQAQEAQAQLERLAEARAEIAQIQIRIEQIDRQIRDVDVIFVASVLASI